MTGICGETTISTLRQKSKGTFFLIPLISLSLVGLSFLLQAHIDLSLQDEGFLWYGAFRTWLGEIPIRDFQAYDPGRYYWVAIWAKTLGNSLISFRISLAAFQWLGLTCGLFAASRSITSRFLLTVTGLALLLWMYPRHKIFEHSLAMASVYVGVLLIERPTVRRHFLAGIFVGIVAFFGRNHGLYSLLGFSLIIVFLQYKYCEGKLYKKTAVFFLGLILGYLPMIIMLASVSGFANAFWESIRVLVEQGRTNIPLPVPWPWRINFSQDRLLDLILQSLVGLVFLTVPIFFVVGLLYILRIDKQRVKASALFISSCFIGVMYMHVAFSRADINHLAQSLHPFLLGIISIPVSNLNAHAFIRKYVVLTVMLVSLFSIGLVSPFYKWISNSDSFVPIVIDRDKILVKKDTAHIITTIDNINKDLVKEGEQFLIAPHWPMLYPILKRKCPLWESYFLHKRSPATQRDMINQLKIQNTNWVVLGDVPLDGRDELRFRYTHHLLWEYINCEYEVCQGINLPANYALWKKKIVQHTTTN